MAITRRNSPPPAPKGPTYLLMDSASEPLARGVLQGAADAANLQFRITDGSPDDLVAAEILIAVPPDAKTPARLGRVILRRGNLIVLDPIQALGEEARQNLRMPADFESFVYPGSGGRVPIRAANISSSGMAFYAAHPFRLHEFFEVVVPIVLEGPLILQAEVLRVEPFEDGAQLYAVRFVNMIHDEESRVREAVFSIQVHSKNAPKKKLSTTLPKG